jgi:hypothetical protein
LAELDSASAALGNDDLGAAELPDDLRRPKIGTVLAGIGPAGLAWSAVCIGTPKHAAPRHRPELSPPDGLLALFGQLAGLGSRGRHVQGTSTTRRREAVSGNT